MASIERQLRKNKTRLEKRLRKDAFDAYPEESYFIPESDEEEEPSYQLVRTKRCLLYTSSPRRLDPISG